MGRTVSVFIRAEIVKVYTMVVEYCLWGPTRRRGPGRLLDLGHDCASNDQRGALKQHTYISRL